MIHSYLEENKTENSDPVLDDPVEKIENKESTVELDAAKESNVEEEKKAEIETVEDLTLPVNFHKKMKVYIS